MPILEILAVVFALFASDGPPDVRPHLALATGTTFYRPVGAIDTTAHADFRTGFAHVRRAKYRSDGRRLAGHRYRSPTRFSSTGAYYRTSGGRFSFHSQNVYRDCGVRRSYPRCAPRVYRASRCGNYRRPIVYVSMRYR